MIGYMDFPLRRVVVVGSAAVLYLYLYLKLEFNSSHPLTRTHKINQTKAVSGGRVLVCWESASDDAHTRTDRDVSNSVEFSIVISARLPIGSGRDEK